MSDQDKADDGTLVPAGHRDLAPTAAANSLVSRGLADLAQCTLHVASDSVDLDSKGISALIIQGCRRKGQAAVKDFSKAIKAIRDNADVRCDTFLLAMVFTLRGRAWQKIKEYENAINDFDEAIRVVPNTHPNLMGLAFFGRADMWRAKKEFEKAMEDYDKAIPLDLPAHGQGYAWFETEEGDFDEEAWAKTMKEFNDSLRLFSKNASVLYLRAIAFWQHGEFEKAVKDFDEVISLKPQLVSALGSLAWLLATCQDEKVRDGKRAIHIAKDACELTGWKSGSALETLAAAYAEAGVFSEAERYQKMALADTPTGFAEDELRKRLELYKQQKPHRQCP
jgi:tetratricopeptide (TPR) repeat protein